MLQALVGDFDVVCARVAGGPHSVLFGNPQRTQALRNQHYPGETPAKGFSSIEMADVV